MRLYLRIVHDDLQEGHLSNKEIVIIIYVFDCGEQDVKFVQLVSSRHPSFDSHVQVIQGPSVQVLHSALFVGVVVYQGLKIGPFIKQVLPVSQIRFSWYHEELSHDIVLGLQILHEVDKGDSFSKAMLVSQNFVLVGHKSFIQTVQTSFLELYQLYIFALKMCFFADFATFTIYLAIAFLLSVTCAHFCQVAVKVCFLAVENFGRAAVAIFLAHLMLDLQQLLMIVDVLRINESGAHINVPFFCEKFLDLFEVIAFEGT